MHKRGSIWRFMMFHLDGSQEQAAYQTVLQKETKLHPHLDRLLLNSVSFDVLQKLFCIIFLW